MVHKSGKSSLIQADSKPALLQRLKDLEDENQFLRAELKRSQPKYPDHASHWSRQTGRFILHGAESQIIDILNLLPDMIMVVDLKGRVIAWNQAAENLTGVTADDMLGKGNHEYAIPFYGVRRPILLDFIINPQLAYDPAYPYYKHQDNIMVAENYCPGVGLHIRATAGPLFDSKGRMVGAIELLRDISDSKEAQAALQASEAMYRRIVETAAEGIWMVDERNRTTFVNLCMAEMLGYTPEEMIGHPVCDYLDQEDLEATGQILEDIKNNPRSRYDFRFRCRNGSHLWTIGAANGIYDPDGRYLGILGMFTDITERKRFDQQMARLDRLNLVGKIAAGIGHEIRNPMTSVRGFLQMLGQQPKYQEDIVYFDIMIEELDRANSIITEFLNLAQTKTVDLEPQNINRIIAAVYPLIQAEAMVSDKNALLELHNAPPALLDEKEIRQLILNLSRNAMEAMEPGGSFTIKTFTEDNEVVLTIQDEGTGIDPQVLDRLGTPFFTTKDRGTGLGLAVCYGIVSRHHAVMEFDSRPGGTTVFIRFKACLDSLPLI